MYSSRTALDLHEEILNLRRDVLTTAGPALAGVFDGQIFDRDREVGERKITGRIYDDGTMIFLVILADGQPIIDLEVDPWTEDDIHDHVQQYVERAMAESIVIDF